MLFIGQSAPDIRCKLQKLDVASSDTIEKLTVDYTVYVAQPETTVRGAKREEKCSVVLLAQASQRTPLMGEGGSGLRRRGNEEEGSLEIGMPHPCSRCPYCSGNSSLNHRITCITELLASHFERYQIALLDNPYVHLK